MQGGSPRVQSSLGSGIPLTRSARPSPFNVGQPQDPLRPEEGTKQKTPDFYNGHPPPISTSMTA